MNIKIVVEHEGKILSEVERELDYEITNDGPEDVGTSVIIYDPKENDLVYQAVRKAEDEMYQNPEMWANGCDHTDYQELYIDKV
jgi:hypothetical protein